MIRRVRYAVGAALAATVLSGCVGLHADPAIRTGLAVGADSGDRVVYVPPGPQEGASPEAIVRGFVRAAAVPGEGVTVARSYLTRALAATWNPDARADVVSATDGELRLVRPGVYELRATLLGQVGPDGRYVPAGEKKTSVLRVEVSTEGGQPRISALPEGVGRWLSRSALNQVMSPVELHYEALTDNDVLVPDVRWLVKDRMATRLTQAQLGPIPPYLIGSVRTDLANLRLLVDAVPVTAGIAVVDFASERVSPDPAARRGMWGQLVATLTGSPDVSAVEVTVEGAGLDLNGISAPVASISELGFHPVVPSAALPVLRVGQGVYSIDPARIGQPDLGRIVEQQASFSPISAQFTELALAGDGKELAGVAHGELARFRDAEAQSVPNFGTDLTGPAYDARGWLWVGGRAGSRGQAGAIWVVDSGVWPATEPAAAARRISVPWLAERRPVALALAADGSRAAVISTDREGADVRLDIAGIVRDGSGAPTGLASAPLRLAPGLRALTDVAWINGTDLGVLADDPDSAAPRPYVVTLGQQVRALPAVEGATAITTLGGERRLVVAGSTGLKLRAGGTWQQIAVGEGIVVAGR